MELIHLSRSRTCRESKKSTMSVRSANRVALSARRFAGGRKPQIRKNTSVGQSPYEMVTASPRLHHSKSRA